MDSVLGCLHVGSVTNFMQSGKDMATISWNTLDALDLACKRTLYNSTWTKEHPIDQIENDYSQCVTYEEPDANRETGNVRAGVLGMHPK